jgi:glucose/arabinose dehydrogenase
MNSSKFLVGAMFGLAACGAVDTDLLAQDASFESAVIADFDEPWAMAFLPDGRLLVTEKAGSLKLLDIDSGETAEISGVPEVAYGGQGGFGDVVLHPDYLDNQLVYLSYGEPGEDRTSGAAVARARLELDSAGGELAEFEVIWRQSPKVRGGGHYGQRIAFHDGYLWISAGERQQGEPAQDLNQTLGKIVRLNYDGSVPSDNPFASEGRVAAEVWSLGHRNPLGLAFDTSGQLWDIEMGPQGGDELNRVERGANYGWPTVSNGVNYGGGPIPDHDTRPEFHPPAVYWLRDSDDGQSISPSSLLFYDGDAFPAWRGDAFAGGLAGQYISRIEVDDDSATEVERFDMGTRIRGLAQGPDGAIWVLEDEGRRGGQGRLLKLTPTD